jgi:hypothetical protein
MMGFSLIFLIVILELLAGSVIGLAALWYRVLRRQRGDDLPACAKCGYATRGLESLHCPECGADLREEGIVTPRQRPMVRPTVFLVLWSVLLIAPVCLVSIMLRDHVPTTPHKSGSATLYPAKSGAYQSIWIDVLGGVYFDTLEVMIIGSTGQVVRSTMDLQVMQYSKVYVITTNPSASSMAMAKF